MKNGVNKKLKLGHFEVKQFFFHLFLFNLICITIKSLQQTATLLSFQEFSGSFFSKVVSFDELLWRKHLVENLI